MNIEPCKAMERLCALKRKDVHHDLEGRYTVRPPSSGKAMTSSSKSRIGAVPQILTPQLEDLFQIPLIGIRSDLPSSFRDAPDGPLETVCESSDCITFHHKSAAGTCPNVPATEFLIFWKLWFLQRNDAYSGTLRNIPSSPSTRSVHNMKATTSQSKSRSAPPSTGRASRLHHGACVTASPCRLISTAADCRAIIVISDARRAL
jgi:hypothetical protein